MDIINELLDEYGDAIYNFCLYLAKNKQDGEDLFQQTFLRAIEISHKIDKNNNPKSYLMSVAINVWKNTIQKKARHQRIVPIISNLEDMENMLVDWSISVESEVIQSAMSDILQNLTHKLDDKYRIPIILFYTEEMKIFEIASLLKKPEGTIKRRLHEAKKKLKKDMEALGYE